MQLEGSSVSDSDSVPVAVAVPMSDSVTVSVPESVPDKEGKAIFCKRVSWAALSRGSIEPGIEREGVLLFEHIIAARV